MEKSCEYFEEKDAAQSSNVFFYRNSWNHRLKELLEDGTTKYTKKGGFKTAEEAQRNFEKCEKEYEKQKRQFQIRLKKKSEMMLTEYLVYWFEDVFSERIQTTTKLLGAYTLYNLLLPSIDVDIKMKYVSAGILDSILEKASKSSDSAGNKSREFLNLAFKDAVIDGFVKNNPVPDTKPYKRKKPTIRIYSKPMLKTFLKAAYYSNWYLEILLGLFCGLRKGEILGLKFSDFDFENHTVKISRQLVSDPKISSKYIVEEYKRTERDPKTPNSFRTLRVPLVVMEEVRKRKQYMEFLKEQHEDEFQDNDYITCQKNGCPRSASSMNQALKKLCVRNALPLITVHGLRHMYATILIERGVPLVKISGLLGHSSIHTTFEYYCDVMDEKNKIIDFMNQTFIPERTGTEG